MKIKYGYINYEKINKITSKYKLIISVCLLCSVLNLAGCKSNDTNIEAETNSNSIEEEIIQSEDESQRYSVQLIFSNLNYLAEGEKDVIVVYDKDGNIYNAFYIFNNEENFEISVPVKKLMVSSKMLGTVEIHLEKDEEAYVYIDYLNKTISAEKESSISKLIK